MLGILKKQDTFVLNHSATILPQDIKDAGELITYVIGVNNYLIDHQKTGWLNIQKVREKKKGNLVLFAIDLELPVLEDNIYFERLLAPFYTKRKLPYETSLNESKEKQPTEAVNESKISPVTSDGQSPLTVRQETSLEPIVHSENVEPITSHESPVIPYEMLTLQEELALKEREIQRLKAQLEKQPVPLPVTQQSNQSISVASFLETELTELTDSLKQMDQRDSIKERVIATYQEKKEQAIHQKTIELDQEETRLIEEQNKKHEQALATIRAEALSKKTAALGDLSKEFETQCTEEISKEYQRQTTDLDNYLTRRKEELLSWNHSIGEGLEAKLESVIQTFNLST